MTFPPAERLLRYQISCDATRTATRPGMPGRIFFARASGKQGCDSSTSQLERYCAIYQHVQRPTGLKLHGAAWSASVFQTRDRPRWVVRFPSTVRCPLPVFADWRTFSGAIRRSRTCQKTDLCGNGGLWRLADVLSIVIDVCYWGGQT